MVVAVAVHAREKKKCPDEPCFLAVVREKAQSLTKGGTYGAAHNFKRGEHAARINWLHFASVDRDGTRKYVEHDRDAAFVHPCEAVLPNVKVWLARPHLKVRQGVYKLTHEAHEAITLMAV